VEIPRRAVCIAFLACLVGALGAFGGAGCSGSNSATPGGGPEDASTDASGARGGDAGGALPVVTGPVTGGSGKPVTATPLDLTAYGYVEQEYFLEGEATAYDWLSPPGEDGVWSVKPTTTAHYKTRILARYPTDASKFNGTVLVEWLNDTGGSDVDPDFGYGHVQLLRSGFAYVGVSAQAEGVVGGGLSIVANAVPLIKADPQRYGSLTHPGDDYAYDIFTQAARSVRQPGAVNPLGNLKATRLIGDGESQSAIRMVTYVDAIEPVSKAFDGFFIHSRFSGGALLNGFADAGVGAILAGPSPARIRGDLTVPVFQFETETDVPGLASGLTGVGFAVSRQPDTALLRTWEIAGTAHADEYLLDYEAGSALGDGGAADSGVSPASALGCGTPNEGPQHWVEDAALSALETWMTGGPPPANGTPFVLADAGTTMIAQDAHGNALGGVRTAAVDVPIATYSGQADTTSLVCSFFGSTTPFSATELATLYPSHDDYVAKVVNATATAQNAGFIVAADAPLIMQEAASAPVPP
jgi:Alpha/beta hydrolase domain